MEIQGTPAIVTGGASGLGAGTARYLAANGAKVALFDVQIDKAQALADEINGIAIYCDVTSAESVEKAINEAREANGTCGIAVN